MRTNADITIYNRYFDTLIRLDRYQRTVLKGVFWDENKAVNTIQSGLESADKVFIAIPFQVSSDREYLSPKEFEKVEDKSNYFTFKEGDRIVKGNIGFEIISKVSDLDKEYEAFTITSVDTKDFGSSHMRHWEVGAK